LQIAAAAAARVATADAAQRLADTVEALIPQQVRP
jgi:hypothetical protein